jgi:hypothetical protein
MRWLGLGRRRAPLSISVALTSFGFFSSLGLDWLGMPKRKVSVCLSVCRKRTEKPTADLGHDR